MSLTVNIAIVDWPSFREAIARGDSFLAICEHFSPEDFSCESDFMRLEFLQCFDTWGDRWKSPGRIAFVEVTNAWCWALRDDGKGIYDIPVNSIPEYLPFQCVWSPETVRRFAKRWSVIDLEECRDFFEMAEDDRGAFETFEDFRDYAMEWGDILERAAEQGLGLVIWVV